MSRCDLSGSALRALDSCPKALALRHLELGDNPLGDEGIAALAGWPGLQSLDELLLVETEMGDGGTRALAASPHLDCLLRLDVSGNGLSARARAALRKRWGDESVEISY
jgi:hypothetical protein